MFPVFAVGVDVVRSTCLRELPDLDRTRGSNRGVRSAPRVGLDGHIAQRHLGLELKNEGTAPPHAHSKQHPHQPAYQSERTATRSPRTSGPTYAGTDDEAKETELENDATSLGVERLGMRLNHS